MKRIVQNLLAVFLLAVLLVPVTALGAETECEHVMPETAEWTWTSLPQPGEGFATYTITVRCEKCNKVLYVRNGGADSSHKVKNATCTDDEIWEYRIQYPLNGKTYTGTKEVEKKGTAKGHTYITVPGKAATCAKTGLTDGVKCKFCPVVKVAQTEIPKKTDHNNIIQTQPYVPATCTEDGHEAEKTCMTCGTITKPATIIKATGHTEVIDKALQRMQ